MSNKGIRKLHELDNTVSYEQLQAELEGYKQSLTVQQLIGCDLRDEIARLKGLLKRAKPTSINGGKADLFLEITEALRVACKNCKWISEAMEYNITGHKETRYRYKCNHPICFGDDVYNCITGEMEKSNLRKTTLKKWPNGSTSGFVLLDCDVLNKDGDCPHHEKENEDE